MATRNELTAAVAARYRTSDRAKKARILDEFVDITDSIASTRCGFFEVRKRRPGRRTRRRVYN